MCTYDDDVSPYLRRPLRTYEEFLQDQAERTWRTDPTEAANGLTPGEDGDAGS